jgi:hypothetical protein
MLKQYNTAPLFQNLYLNKASISLKFMLILMYPVEFINQVQTYSLIQSTGNNNLPGEIYTFCPSWMTKLSSLRWAVYIVFMRKGGVSKTVWSVNNDRDSTWVTYVYVIKKY